jgi:hypothetical protein
VIELIINGAYLVQACTFITCVHSVAIIDSYLTIFVARNFLPYLSPPCNIEFSEPLRRQYSGIRFCVSLKYNQQDATFSRSIYFYKLLYMFQAVPPPIIRNTKLYIQGQILSNQYCCLLLSWMRWN